MAEIKLKSLSKKFGKTDALHPLDLEIRDGEFMTILGPSGCGKSTLLNLLAGLEAPTTGDILFDGESVIELSPKQRDVAFVFQSYALYPHKSVYDNIAFPLAVVKTDKKEIDKQVHQVAQLLEIENLLERRPKELSGGQRQRVALGRAIIRRPRVFLFDEPLSNLDAQLRTQMRTELKKLHRKLKTTFIYVTHDQTEAMSLADTIAILRDGNLLQTGTPEKIYKEPANMFIGSFIGNPGMNFVNAELIENGAKVKLENRIFELSLIVGKPGEIMAGLRPEYIQIADEKHPGTIPARVEVVEHLGSEALIEVTTRNNSTLIIRTAQELDLSMNDEISLNLDLSKASFFDKSTGSNLPIGE
ncbi:MAG: ATP-binding cassette domain-containing protein [candidate division Zixibacteria bacterium]|nr:ATP-binding cassette domain-containing protein [candidate division Zixibacteria bacterium]